LIVPNQKSAQDYPIFQRNIGVLIVCTPEIEHGFFGRSRVKCVGIACRNYFFYNFPYLMTVFRFRFPDFYQAAVFFVNETSLVISTD
jgi:hypothetical protein